MFISLCFLIAGAVWSSASPARPSTVPVMVGRLLNYESKPFLPWVALVRDFGTNRDSQKQVCCCDAILPRQVLCSHCAHSQGCWSQGCIGSTFTLSHSKVPDSDEKLCSPRSSGETGTILRVNSPEPLKLYFLKTHLFFQNNMKRLKLIWKSNCFEPWAPRPILSPQTYTFPVPTSQLILSYIQRKQFSPIFQSL